MRIIIVSGLSGSGKTIALQTLEDLDYYCVDNLPFKRFCPWRGKSPPPATCCRRPWRWGWTRAISSMNCTGFPPR